MATKQTTVRSAVAWRHAPLSWAAGLLLAGGDDVSSRPAIGCRAVIRNLIDTWRICLRAGRDAQLLPCRPADRYPGPNAHTGPDGRTSVNQPLASVPVTAFLPTPPHYRMGVYYERGGEPCVTASRAHTIRRCGPASRRGGSKAYFGLQPSYHWYTWDLYRSHGYQW